VNKLKSWFVSNFIVKTDYRGANIALLSTMVAGIGACTKILMSSVSYKVDYVLATFSLYMVVIAAEIAYKKINVVLEETRKRIVELNESTRDITIYNNSEDGLRYCIDNMPNAEIVMNTALFSSRHSFAEKNYLEWMKAKKIFVSDSAKTLKEIISSNFNASDLPCKFVAENVSQGYMYRYIDDKHCPMVQVTIFHKRKGNKLYKEVVFGWELLNTADGPCFRTRHPEIVRYFEEYFNYFFQDEKKTQSTPTIIKQVLIPKCELIFSPGVWLYLLYAHPDPKLNSVYGVITISDNEEEEVTHKYQAEAIVWYFGGQERGSWYSTGYTPDIKKQNLHINYNMKIVNPSDKELLDNIDKYKGCLHFEPEDQKNGFYIGRFKGTEGDVKSGKIMVKPCVYKDDNTRIVESWDKIDLRDAFDRVFGVDITDSKHVNNFK
jgi:hypothetical protein